MKRLLTLFTIIGICTVVTDNCLAAPSIERGIDFELPWNDLKASHNDTDRPSRMIASYLPKGVKSSNDFAAVAESLASGTLRNYSDSEEFEESELGQTVGSIESVLMPSVSLFGSKKNEKINEEDPYRTVIPKSNYEHEIEVSLDAPNSKAKIKYHGLLDVDAQFNVEGDIDLSLRKALDKTTSIKMVHNTQNAESVLSLDYRW